MNPLAVKYVNRLSDLLFILSRGANAGDEPLWDPKGERIRVYRATRGRAGARGAAAATRA